MDNATEWNHFIIERHNVARLRGQLRRTYRYDCGCGWKGTLRSQADATADYIDHYLDASDQMVYEAAH